MSRLIATLPEDAKLTSEIVHGSKNSEWQYIREEIMNTDLEKGIEDINVILQRKSDNKYFEFEYAHNYQLSLDAPGMANDWPLEGNEVFPKQKIITTYE